MSHDLRVSSLASLARCNYCFLLEKTDTHNNYKELKSCLYINCICNVVITNID